MANDPVLVDWTQAKDGRSNSSPIFLQLCVEVDRLIRDSASSLIAGQSRAVAGLILAQLAHVHGLVPWDSIQEFDKVKLATALVVARGDLAEHARCPDCNHVAGVCSHE